MNLILVAPPSSPIINWLSDLSFQVCNLIDAFPPSPLQFSISTSKVSLRLDTECLVRFSLDVNTRLQNSSGFLPYHLLEPPCYQALGGKTRPLETSSSSSRLGAFDSLRSEAPPHSSCCFAAAKKPDPKRVVFHLSGFFDRCKVEVLLLGAAWAAGFC